MTNTRKCLVVVAAAAFILSGLFPPWLYTVGAQSAGSRIGAQSEKNAGYHFLLTPPAPQADTVYFGIKLDVTRLAIEWLCIVVATGTAWVLLSTKGHPTTTNPSPRNTSDPAGNPTTKGPPDASTTEQELPVSEAVAGDDVQPEQDQPGDTPNSKLWKRVYSAAQKARPAETLPRTHRWTSILRIVPVKSATSQPLQSTSPEAPQGAEPVQQEGATARPDKLIAMLSSDVELLTVWKQLVPMTLQGVEIKAFSDSGAALRALPGSHSDLFIVGPSLEGIDPLQALSAAADMKITCPVLLVESAI